MALILHSPTPSPPGQLRGLPGGTASRQGLGTMVGRKGQRGHGAPGASVPEGATAALAP